MTNLIEERGYFETWIATKGKQHQLKWSGTKYQHPRIQSLWTAFLFGWMMCKNKKG